MTSRGNIISSLMNVNIVPREAFVRKADAFNCRECVSRAFHS